MAFLSISTSIWQTHESFEYFSKVDKNYGLHANCCQDILQKDRKLCYANFYLVILPTIQDVWTKQECLVLKFY